MREASTGRVIIMAGKRSRDKQSAESDAQKKTKLDLDQASKHLYVKLVVLVAHDVCGCGQWLC